MKILVINAGSSSLKYQLIDVESGDVIAKGLCERIGIENSKLTYKPAGKEPFELVQNMKDHTDAIKLVLDALVDEKHGVISDMSEIDAVGHRVVHGGEKFAESVLLTDEVLETIESLNDLAPLHNPANLMGIRACKAIMPNTPMVGVFDTAFHQTMPKEAFIYGLPYEAYTDNMVRRYGFHGTSHNYVTLRAIEMLGKPAEETKIITCHLGNGSSISAVKGGKCIDTTMGFTPLDGLEMGTRCGSIDPAIVTYIMKKEGFTPDEMSEFMNKKCGFLGISGYSSDSRDIEKGILEGNHRAYLAASILAYQVKKYIGAFTAAMDGLDAIVFTAGMGENNPELRERVCKDMTYFGIEIDTELNAKMFRQPNTVKLSTENSKVLVYLLPTNEELMIASDTEEIVKKLKK